MSQTLVLGRTAAERKLVDGAFLFCADCRAVHRVTRSDRAAIFAVDGTAIANDDAHKFLGAHLEHTLQVLRRSSEAEMMSHPRWDPMCRVAWDVSDGERDFVVTFGRADVETPREYTIAPGHMVLTHESVEVDAETMHHAIDEALYPHAVSVRKIESLIQRCRQMVAATPLELFEPLDESRAEANVQLACLPGPVVDALRTELPCWFSDVETECLREVIDKDLRLYIPIVRCTRQYRIEG
jgi:hypothetical protein